jgi:hypothetical protein
VNEVQDYEVIAMVARRLFEESAEEFRDAHERVTKSFNATTVDGHFQDFCEGIEQEQQAITKLNEAIALQRLAISERER